MLQLCPTKLTQLGRHAVAQRHELCAYATSPSATPPPSPPPLAVRVYQKSMYETAWWRVTSQVWETCVLAFVGDWAPLTWAVCAGAGYWAWRRRRRLPRKAKSEDWWQGQGGGGGGGVTGSGGSGSGGLMSWWLGSGGSKKKRRTADGVLRDLDV